MLNPRPCLLILSACLPLHLPLLFLSLSSLSLSLSLLSRVQGAAPFTAQVQLTCLSALCSMKFIISVELRVSAQKPTMMRTICLVTSGNLATHMHVAVDPPALFVTACHLTQHHDGRWILAVQRLF